jgi:hypothetical protein
LAPDQVRLWARFRREAAAADTPFSKFRCGGGGGVTAIDPLTSTRIILG